MTFTEGQERCFALNGYELFQYDGKKSSPDGVANVCKLNSLEQKLAQDSKIVFLVYEDTY